ncbi:MAG: CocE/NonD family hydrolase [Pyrinomonadaceae bacterium]|nr:CocE/NonD family hydrolase [Pyrinomonadaceae bacterium]
MKATVLFVLVFAFTLVTFGQAPAPKVDELAVYIKEHYTKREVQIPMRDGVKLFTSIYEPKDKSQKYPIMMSRTPYSVAPYGPDKFKTSLGPDYQFAREGYIFVYQDVRGRWMSEGTFVDVRPEVAQYGKAKFDESTDTYDTIDWLIKNVDNNNGRVGTYGISYPGYYTSAGSINSHPALKACSPQAPVSDWYHGDDMHHNGALFLAQNYSFYRFFQPFTTPSDSFTYMKQWKGRDTQDGYDYFLKLGGLQEVADSFVAGLGVRQPYWDDMQDHPNYDQYWKDRNVLTHLNKVGCATMTVGGWYDNEDLYGALNTYRHIEKQNPGIFNILVVGPWFHGGWARSEGEWLGTAYFGSETSEYYRVNMELPFFNHFLKDKGDISNLKEVNVFDTGSNVWRSFNEFEPTSSIDTALYFTKGGGLSFTRPTSVGYNEYVSDPMKPVPYTQKITLNYPRDYMTEDQRFASTRPDVLVYETAPLESDITVAGDIKPSLYLSSSGTDSDFIVKLIDVFPDDYKFPEGKKPPENSAFSVFQPGGYQMLLRGEPMPARFREGFEKGVPLVPNKVTYLGFTMPGITHTFKKGHRIMVQVQSTWFPLVARSPQQFVANNFKATTADFRKATQRIYFGGRSDSAVILPIQK